MSTCFQPAEIMLPDDTIDKSKWSVIACDQFTSQPDYWSDAERYVSSACSALHIIFPEIYLGRDPGRIQQIHNNMEIYLNDGTLKTAVPSGYVLVERRTASGIRLGLVGQIDLEQYDFNPEGVPLIRATEGTVLSRIPPRVDIRRNAKLESPHVMLLFDDPECSLIEQLYEKRDALRLVYDTELMLGGGHVRGFAVEQECAEYVTSAFKKMERNCNGLLFAVGDGNHSLAAAKACWEEIRRDLNPDEVLSHPARYALVEVVNLHSSAICFEPIHRILFGADMCGLTDFFRRELERQHLELSDGSEIIFLQGGNEIRYSITNRGERLPVEILQNILDSYLKEHSEITIDYIHGEETLKELVKTTGGCGILLQTIEKKTFFAAIRAGGVLPRKTFSIGKANEKRYYMECKKL